MNLRRLTFVGVCAVSLGTFVGAHAVPLVAENDDFEEATIIESLPYQARQTAPVATKQVGEWACGPLSEGEFTTWYRYTAAEGVGSVRVHPHQRVMVNVYTGTDLFTLTEVAGTQHRWAQSFEFTTIPGTTYSIQLCGFAEDGLVRGNPLHADFEDGQN